MFEIICAGQLFYPLRTQLKNKDRAEGSQKENEKNTQNGAYIQTSTAKVFVWVCSLYFKTERNSNDSVHTSCSVSCLLPINMNYTELL